MVLATGAPRTFFPPPQKNGLDTRLLWAGRRCVFSLRAYVYAYHWASEASPSLSLAMLHTIYTMYGPRCASSRPTLCFYITPACQELLGAPCSPRSPCVSYATVSHRTSSLPRLLRGHQPPEPPWFLRHCISSLYTCMWLFTL